LTPASAALACPTIKQRRSSAIWPARKSVRIQGAMMTFTEDPEFDGEQLRRFHETCAALEKDGISLGKKHAASSFTLFQHPEAFLDMVRPGMAIYGIYSETNSATPRSWISAPPSA